MNKKNIAILGSTGSVGTQALDVVRAFPDLLKVSVLTGGSNVELLIAQAREFKPQAVLLTDESAYGRLKDGLADLNIELLSGVDALTEVVERADIDMVLNAVVGAAGLKPTVAAIKKGKDIALANKETLVVAGELIMGLAEKHKVKILPVDSEHSAIFQCLVGEDLNPIEKIYLTASGGPFRGKDREFLATVTKLQALKHPNWVMGAKITIDSASLMNKGLEVIEAKWLFDLAVDQIDVIIHPQSVIHSIVQFEDGSMKAQMGVPDMKLPIQNALTFPYRMSNTFERFDFMKYPNFSFEQADMETFRNLNLAYKALRDGGDRACVLNAANEVAVAAFLNDDLSFLGMSELIEATMCQQPFVQQPTLNDYIAIDQQTRIVARDLINKI